MGWWDLLKQCPCEFSRTTGPQNESSQKHVAPALIHPCHYASHNTFMLMHNDRDVSMQVHCVYETIHLGDQGSRKFVWGHIVSGGLMTPPFGKNIFGKKGKRLRSFGYLCGSVCPAGGTERTRAQQTPTRFSTWGGKVCSSFPQVKLTRKDSILL